MKKARNTAAAAAELRRRAQARLRAAAESAPDPTGADARRILHELRVHQIELEMQNEELRQSRTEVEAGLGRYTDLYDFAPVGYLTVGRDGTIRQVNLTGSRLLGVARGQMAGRRFGEFVAEPDRPAFNALLEKAFARRTPEVCEVALLKSWECRWVTILDDRGQITVEGSFNDVGNSLLAVTGGTGEFRNARGSMTLIARTDITGYDFIFRLIP
jgi:PAS domain S-box-containing protein